MATTGKRSTTTTRTRRNGNKPAAKPPQIDSAAGPIFDAIGESTEALFSLSRKSTDRAYRLSQAAIGDWQAAQRDMLSLAEQWAKSPLDLLGWYTSIIQTAIHTQERLAAGARLWWSELSDAGTETRDALRQSTQANWRAGQAAFGLARSAITKS